MVSPELRKNIFVVWSYIFTLSIIGPVSFYAFYSYFATKDHQTGFLAVGVASAIGSIVMILLINTKLKQSAQLEEGQHRHRRRSRRRQRRQEIP